MQLRVLGGSGDGRVGATMVRRALPALAAAVWWCGSGCAAQQCGSRASDPLLCGEGRVYNSSASAVDCPTPACDGDAARDRCCTPFTAVEQQAFPGALSVEDVFRAVALVALEHTSRREDLNLTIASYTQAASVQATLSTPAGDPSSDAWRQAFRAAAKRAVTGAATVTVASVAGDSLLQISFDIRGAEMEELAVNVSGTASPLTTALAAALQNQLISARLGDSSSEVRVLALARVGAGAVRCWRDSGAYAGKRLQAGRIL